MLPVLVMLPLLLLRPPLREAAPVTVRPPVPWMEPVPALMPTAVTAPALLTWNWLVAPTLKRPEGLVEPMATPLPLSYTSELVSWVAPALLYLVMKFWVPAVVETPPLQFPNVNKQTVSVVLVSAGMDRATLLAWVAEVMVTLLVALPTVASTR